LVNNVLMWLTCATCPLEVKELQHVLVLTQDLGCAEENHSCEVDEDAITDVNLLTSVCVGLVVVDDMYTLRLVCESLPLLEKFSCHSLTPQDYTTQEYFQNRCHNLFQDAQIIIAQICLRYASECVVTESLYYSHSKHWFMEYASQHWSDHVKDCSLHSPQTTLTIEVLSNDLKRSRIVNNWQNYNAFGNMDWEDTSTLHAAALFEQHKIMQYLADHKGGLNSLDSRDQTPLFYAARRGHSLSVRVLVEMGADFSALDKDVRSPLSYAAANGNGSESVKILVERGAVSMHLTRMVTHSYL
jgi:hypothetical protein